MKKIFAFILASIMVLSLVPASAFAAVTNCPKTHTVAVCESLGISYTKIDVQAPNCKSAGYTIYECDKCGKQFADNFTEKAAHVNVSNTKLAHLDKKADCKEGIAGLTHLICTICGTATVETVPANHKDAHKLTLIAGSGIGCAARYLCSVCGEEGFLDENGMLVKAATHKWTFASVEKEPTIVNGVLTNGTATYKCEVCGDIKKVEILSECKHYGLADNLVIDYAEATCDVAGSVPVYQCLDCNALFTIDSESASFVKLVDVNKDGEVDLTDAAIPALGHDYDESKGVKNENACEMIYFCDVCEAYITKEYHENAVDLGDPVGFASCISKQYFNKFCTDCNTYFVEEDASLLDPTHEVVSYILPSTCGSIGYKGKYCLTCGELELSDIYNGNLVEGYDYWKVVENPDTNPVTHYYPVVERATIAKNPNAHKLYDANSGEWEEDLVVACNASAQIRYMTCAECDDYGFQLWRQTATAHKKTVKLGSISHYKDAKLYVTIPSYTFEYNGIVYTVKATNIEISAKKSADIYFCEVCSKAHKVETDRGSAKTTYFYADLAAVCKEYNCLELNVLPIDPSSLDIIAGRYVDVVKKDSSYGAYTNISINWAKAQYPANCAVKGYVPFTAAYEGSGTRYAYLSSNEHTKADGAKWVAGKAPTCTEVGTHGYYVCSKCGAKFAYVGGLNDSADWEVRGSIVTDEQKELTSLVLNKHSATLTDVTIDVCTPVTYYHCYECNKADFEDENASKAFDISKAHAWIYAKGYEGKPATCNQDGTLQIRTCANCSKIEFIALYETNGYVNIKLIHTANLAEVENGEFDLPGEFAPMEVIKFKVSADGKVATDLSVTKVSGIVPMFEHAAPYTGFVYLVANSEINDYVEIECVEGQSLIFADDWALEENVTLDHTKPMFVENACVACQAEILTNYVPAAGGHINAAGEILTTECDNEYINDRICVLCNKEIAVAHVKSEPITVEPTCVAVGYTYWYCLTEGCDKQEMTGAAEDPDKYDIDPDAHELVTYGFEANYGHDGQSYTQCILCGEITAKPSSIPAPKVAGVEIELTTDHDSYMPGSIVNVTVSLESLLGVNVWAARFPVTYNPAVYEFVGVLEGSIATEFNSAYSVFTTNDIIKIGATKLPGGDIWTPTGAKGPAGIVSVIAQADSNIFVKGSYDLVTLQFKVVATEVDADTDTTFAVKAGYVKNPDKTYEDDFSNIIVDTWNEIDCPIEVVDAKSKTVKSMFGDAQNSVAPVIYGFLDLDMDGARTLADAKALYALIIDPDAEYSVLADADADGFITIADLNALYQIFTGAKTVNEILNPKAEKVLGPREIRYENNEIVYDSYCDFDFSGKIDQTSEMLCMSGREDYKLFWADLGYTIP